MDSEPDFDKLCEHGCEHFNKYVKDYKKTYGKNKVILKMLEILEEICNFDMYKAFIEQITENKKPEKFDFNDFAESPMKKLEKLVKDIKKDQYPDIEIMKKFLKQRDRFLKNKFKQTIDGFRNYFNMRRGENIDDIINKIKNEISENESYMLEKEYDYKRLKLRKKEELTDEEKNSITKYEEILNNIEKTNLKLNNSKIIKKFIENLNKLISQKYKYNSIEYPPLKEPLQPPEIIIEEPPQTDGKSKKNRNKSKKKRSKSKKKRSKSKNFY